MKYSRIIQVCLCAFALMAFVCVDINSQALPSIDRNFGPEGTDSTPESHLMCDGTAVDQAFDAMNFGNARTSDRNTPFTVIDNFTLNVDTKVTSACFWGLYFDFISGACGPGLSMGDDSFEITYFSDAGGVPGAAFAGPFTVTHERENTGVNFFGNVDNFAYRVTHPEVTFLAGEQYWFSVTNDVGVGCFWLWTDNTAIPAVGDGMSFQIGAGVTNSDQAFTLSGESIIVPTLGEWGVIVLGMLFLIFGVVAVSQRKTAIA